ncbi:MAG: rhodanese-like domain-containing protein [Clostridia bacterium]|nr:rhodanese-like domain-containing protein [Clostridia bacterium]
MFNFFCRRRNRCSSRNLIYNLITYEVAREMIENQENILIDVRTKREYDIMHIKNAINIPIEKIRMCENEYKTKKGILVYCSSGIRTKEAIRILNNLGYMNIYIWEYGSLSNFPYKDMLKI